MEAKDCLGVRVDIARGEGMTDSQRKRKLSFERDRETKRKEIRELEEYAKQAKADVRAKRFNSQTNQKPFKKPTEYGNDVEN